MKNKLFSLVLAALCISSVVHGNIDGERCVQSEEAVKQATYGHIDAKALKVLIDSETPMVILDARGHKWNDNTTIPGAFLASYEYENEELESLIPSPNSLVVVYCYSFNCPLSRRLATKLVEMGYNNIVEYPAGLKEWRDVANYPIVEINQ
jgi:rhodanese-related sulfurtransferase